MIMICNVPDEVIKSVRMGTWCGSSVAEKMIANGIPLDKIRAEVENINVWGMRYNPDTDKDRKPQIVQKVKEHVIEILDKYKAESEPQESEDKE